MTTRRNAIALALALGITAAGCSTLEVTTDYDAATSFASYKTFTMRTESTSKDAIAVERVLNALASSLQARGLKRVESDGDLTVHTHFVIGADTQLNTTGYAGWGGWRWGGGTQTTTVQQIPTGTVVVDLVDAKTNKAVWRGIAKDQISKSASPEERQKKADEVATALFANYPPGSKK